MRCRAQSVGFTLGAHHVTMVFQNVSGHVSGHTVLRVSELLSGQRVNQVTESRLLQNRCRPNNMLEPPKRRVFPVYQGNQPLCTPDQIYHVRGSLTQNKKIQAARTPREPPNHNGLPIYDNIVTSGTVGLASDSNPASSPHRTTWHGVLTARTTWHGSPHRTHH